MSEGKDGGRGDDAAAAATAAAAVAAVVRAFSFSSSTSPTCGRGRACLKKALNARNVSLNDLLLLIK